MTHAELGTAVPDATHPYLAFGRTRSDSLNSSRRYRYVVSMKRLGFWSMDTWTVISLGVRVHATRMHEINRINAPFDHIQCSSSPHSCCGQSDEHSPEHLPQIKVSTNDSSARQEYTPRGGKCRTGTQNLVRSVAEILVRSLGEMSPPSRSCIRMLFYTVQPRNEFCSFSGILNRGFSSRIGHCLGRFWGMYNSSRSMFVIYLNMSCGSDGHSGTV